MNTIQETKSRLRLLAAALASVVDNYGVTSAQSVNFATAQGELADIIDSITDAPPAAPITVDSVVGGIGDMIRGLQEQIDNSNNAALAALGDKIEALVSVGGEEKEALADLGGKVAALIGLANNAGQPAAA
ncbi:hypothetical protein [Herbaspirillum robiniae]|uniref:hypothetical protein n=1 Tax=Herbaspirillum robiniae TaxID=2014887 RepID=UPI00178CDCFA|nr:hypothetical protein [Herbaspirillum robiniae]